MVQLDRQCQSNAMALPSNDEEVWFGLSIMTHAGESWHSIRIACTFNTQTNNSADINIKSAAIKQQLKLTLQSQN